MNYSFLSPALNELTRAADYYEEQISGLGYEFVQEVESAIKRILKFPFAWHILHEPYRQCILKRFPYSIIYQVKDPDHIIIVSVFHLHRKPDSWMQNN